MTHTTLSKRARLGILAALAGTATAATLLFSSAAFAQTTASVAAQPLAAAIQHGGKLGGGKGMNTAVVAKALGIDEATLRSELQAGKSVADLAASKNVSLDSIVSALVDAQTAQLKQAVTDGKLTQAQADGLLANYKATVAGHLQVRHVQGLPGRSGRHDGWQRRDAIMEQATTVAAKTLGMTEAELRTEMQAGKTIATVAQSKNIALSTISDALLAEAKTRTAAAVTAGTLTQAQADALLAQAPTAIERFLNTSRPLRGPGRGGRGAPRNAPTQQIAPSTDS
jgi:hypothetical protein